MAAGRARARALDLEPALLTQTQPSNLRVLLDWVDGFPEAEHGPVWLKAFEAGYREQLWRSSGSSSALCLPLEI